MPRAPVVVDPFTVWPGREAVARRFVECIDTAQREALLMYGLPPIGIANADRAVKRALGRGLKIRSLCPEERATTETMQFLEPFMKGGERVRFGRYVPTRLAIFDADVVLVALAVSDATDFKCLEVQHPEMVALATSAFEYAWRDGWEYIQPAKRKSKVSRRL